MEKIWTSLLKAAHALFFGVASQSKGETWAHREVMICPVRAGGAKVGATAQGTARGGEISDFGFTSLAGKKPCAGKHALVLAPCLRTGSK